MFWLCLQQAVDRPGRLVHSWRNRFVQKWSAPRDPEPTLPKGKDCPAPINNLAAEVQQTLRASWTAGDCPIVSLLAIDSPRTED
jgi:hypothetical protein